MANAIYISEAKALDVLMLEGDYTKTQAVIILGHSLKRDINGVTYYPEKYIRQRAKE